METNQNQPNEANKSDRMNSQSSPGTQWEQTKRKIKARFSKLNDSDIDECRHDLDQLRGKVQKAYGYSDEKAGEEFDSFKQSLDGMRSNTQSGLNQSKDQDQTKDQDQSYSKAV
ncbi:MAG: CsbD family protein [Bacteriovoracia bacterium]